MKQRRIGKRLVSLVLCLLLVFGFINMPINTMEVEAAPLTFTTSDGFVCTEYSSPTHPDHVNITGYTGASTDIMIPTTVTDPVTNKQYTVYNITSTAFKDNISITSVTLPDTIKSIANNAFYGCGNLETVIAPEVTSIGDDAFNRCTSLTTVEVPKLTEINGGAFYGCISLQTIDTSKVTFMGIGAFQDCASLESINLSSLIKGSAGNGHLSAYLFWGCNSLSNVTIPASITNIDSNAFLQCSTTVEFLSATPPAVNNNSFGSYITFKVPEGTKATYESAFSAAGVTVDGKITENKPDPGNGGGNGSGNGSGNSDDNSSSSESSSSSTKVEVHTHNLEWVVVSNPTVNSKGTMELRCTSCGHVEDTQSIGNDAVTYESYANKLEEQFRIVPAGGKAKLELGDWHSVPGYMMERILKSNVDVEITYRYKGKNYDIMIPAGKGLDLHIPWYGPLLMKSLYGGRG